MFSKAKRKGLATLFKDHQYLDIIPAFTFVIEAVDSVDGSAFVVSSQQKEVLWVSEINNENLISGIVTYLIL